MGRDFHAAAKPSWPWSDEGFEASIAGLIDRAFLSVSEQGFFLGMIAAFPFNPNWVQAHELLWWSQDGTGPKHAKAFRQWAEGLGANEVCWSCRADNDRVAAFYTKIAQPSELHFSEILTCV